VYRPRSYLSSGYQGTLGSGFPTALGAKVANPEKPVLSINGDGGFMFNVQELATAVQHGIDVVTVVFNDGAFGNVKRMQEDDYDGRVIASELRNPDFIRLAESFGVHAARAGTPQALRGELESAFGRKGASLIEVPMGKVPDPWGVSLPRAKIRG
jgi:acetolactate synthase-1/2/3 large subunit